MAWFRSNALLAALLTLTGCTAKNVNQSYQLKQINAQYFLLPPHAETAPGDRLTFRIPAGGNAVPDVDCSIKGTWFTLVRSSHDKFWTAEVPTAVAWEKSGGTIDMKEEWEAFAATLNGLRQKQCFSPQEYVSLEQTLVANLPAPADEILFYRYGYGMGGYVNLAPGMQLRIERDFFASESPAADPRDYRGTTITSYAVDGNGQNGVHLTFLGVEKKSAGGHTPQAIALDIDLATQFAAAARLRLFLQDLEVSGNAKTPAILVGAANENDVNQATRQVAANPQACTGHLNVTCAIFQGSVTVSPMLQVTVNGKPTYVPIGSKLWSVLPLDSSRNGNVVRTLRVERPYRGKMAEVMFAHDQEGVAQILVMGGDRISWSKKQ
jgi:hypothetical protein